MGTLIILLIGKLQQQLLVDLNSKRPTKIEAIEIGPITSKEENKRENDSKGKQAIDLIDSEVNFDPF